MNRHFRLVTSFLACLFPACTSTEREKTTRSRQVFSKKEIRIEKAGIGKDSVQVASIVEGDSTIFLYSEYTDYGEEGSGRKICFYIDAEPDSSEYAHDGKKIVIIGFGTGMYPNFSDTVETYGFKVSSLGNAIRMQGHIGEVDITGTYIPK